MVECIGFLHKDAVWNVVVGRLCVLGSFSKSLCGCQILWECNIAYPCCVVLWGAVSFHCNAAAPQRTYNLWPRNITCLCCVVLAGLCAQIFGKPGTSLRICKQRVVFTDVSSASMQWIRHCTGNVCNKSELSLARPPTGPSAASSPSCCCRRSGRIADLSPPAVVPGLICPDPIGHRIAVPAFFHMECILPVDCASIEKTKNTSMQIAILQSTMIEWLIRFIAMFEVWGARCPGLMLFQYEVRGLQSEVRCGCVVRV